MDEFHKEGSIDHKEIKINVPPPRLVDASKADITAGQVEVAVGGSEPELGTAVSAQDAFLGIPADAAARAGEKGDEAPCPVPAFFSEEFSTQLPIQETLAQGHGQEDEGPWRASDVKVEEEGRSSSSEVTKEEEEDDTSFVLQQQQREEEKKVVSEYCPGLSIRTLALEDIEKKKPADQPEEPTFSQAAIDPSQYSNLSAGFSSSYSSSVTMQSLGQPRKPLFDPIEVERKFSVAEDTEDRLRALGARLYREKTFRDVYYDSDDYALILQDCWLRRRNDTWEAKIPTRCQQENNSLASPATQYRELSEEREISRWLVETLGLDSWMRGDPLDLLVQAAGLTDFARFTTLRRTYHLPSCVVDLDLTDHGFRVGEIEVMAACPQEVPQALQVIQDVAQQLGLTALILA